MQRRIGIVIILVGIITIAYTGFLLANTEKVVELGPIKISKPESHPAQWSPILGAVLLAGGFIIVALDKKIV